MSKKSIFSRVVVALCIICAGGLSLWAFPNERWATVESEHFLVTYSRQSKELADRAMAIAESTRSSLLAYFGTDLGTRKISIVLSDNNDYGNGGAYYDMPLVRIDCRKVQNVFRGETDWLKTVLTHELSHIYSFYVLSNGVYVATTFNRTSQIENYGINLDIYWGGNNFPQWFIEGLAQMGSHHVGADDHDAIRRMVLGDAVRNQQVLSLQAMERFEGTGRDYELAYNQGFSFLLYLEKTYPKVSLRKLVAWIKNDGFMRAFSELYKGKLDQLYDQWRESLNREFLAKDTDFNSGERFSMHSGPMDMETASADDGRFIISNWGNDYERYNLWRKSKQGKYELIVRETGTALSFDPISGSLLFTESVYNARLGNEIYDLFSLDKKGSIHRLTRGSRVMAFSQQAGNIAYARYVGGKTEIVRHNADGSESVIINFDENTSIYGMDMIDQNRILLNLGTGDRVKAALLTGDQLEFLWPDMEILDAVYAGDNRVVFTSTVGGSSQVYWADLADRSRTWFQISNVPSGARFPLVEQVGDTPSLVYSDYSQGSFHLVRTSHVFNQEHAFSLPPIAKPEDNGTQVTATLFAPSVIPSKTGIMLYPYPLTLMLYDSKFSDVPGARDGWELYADLGVRFGSSTGDAIFLLSTSMDTLLFPTTRSSPDFYINARADFNIGVLRNIIKYQIGLLSEYYSDYDFMDTNTVHHLLVQSGFQLDSFNTLSIYAGINCEIKTSYDMDYTYFLQDYLGLHWVFSENLTSNYDPAHLGQSNVNFSLDGAFLSYAFPEPIFYSSGYWTDAHSTEQISSDNGFRALFSGSRLSLAVRYGGFMGIGGISGQKLTPNYLTYIGGSKLFSGYPQNYARMNSLGWASLEIKTNPFVNVRQSAKWYERFNLGLKFIAGYGQYFSYVSGLLVNAWPLSAEISLNMFMYIRANQESQVSLRFAMPFNDFMVTDNGGLKLPFQVYLDMSF